MERVCKNQISLALESTKSSLTCLHIFVDIKINHILELDQWNHVDALDVEEIMH